MDASILNRKTISLDYADHLHKNLDFLTRGKIGFFKFQPTDIQCKPNKYLETTRGFKNYHFNINIPYAGRMLIWEVIFDPEDFSQLPDFDFNDYTFLPDPDINYIAENIPSWDKWDVTDHHAMLNILNEFLALYKKSQVEKLYKQNKFCNLKTQYEDLLKIKNVTQDKIEVLIENKNDLEINNDDSVLINFLIVLPIDFSGLPEYYQEDWEELVNPGEDFSCLSIQMRKLDNSQTKVTLSLSPRAEQLLGKLKLPKFRKETDIADYVLAVRNLIEDQIKSIIHQHEERNLYIMGVVDEFSSGIIEYDAARFYKVTFVYEDFEEYDCLVTIQLGGKFPEERPKVQLHSLYCQVGRNCNSSIVIPYDSNYGIEQNMQILRETLHEEAKTFQNHKH